MTAFLGTHSCPHFPHLTVGIVIAVMALYCHHPPSLSSPLQHICRLSYVKGMTPILLQIHHDRAYYKMYPAAHTRPS